MDKSKSIWIIVFVFLFLMAIMWRSSEDARQELKPYVTYAEYWDNNETRIQKLVNYLFESDDLTDRFELQRALENAGMELSDILDNAPSLY